MSEDTSSKINRRAYDLVASNYSAEHGESMAWQSELNKFIGYLESPSLVVDLGCGHGDETIYLSEKLPRAKVMGIDFSEQMIRIANAKQSSAEFIVEDIVSFSFPKKANGIWARASFHHLSEPELQAALSNIVRNAASGLVIGTVNKYGDFEETEEKEKYGQVLTRYFNYANEKKAQRIADTFGFKVLEQYIKPEGGHKFLVSYLCKM